MKRVHLTANVDMQLFVQHGETSYHPHVVSKAAHPSDVARDGPGASVIRLLTDTRPRACRVPGRYHVYAYCKPKLVDHRDVG